MFFVLCLVLTAFSVLLGCLVSSIYTWYTIGHGLNPVLAFPLLAIVLFVLSVYLPVWIRYALVARLRYKRTQRKLVSALDKLAQWD